MSTEKTEEEDVAEPTETTEETTAPSNNGQRTSYKLVGGRVQRIVLEGSPSNPVKYVDFPGGVGKLTADEAQAVRDAGYELEETGGEEVK